MVKDKKIVLLVEDSYTVRFILKRTLEEENYQVIVAENGVEGLNKLKENAVDVIVSDIEMPKMDGFTMISKIRNQPKYYTIPIILLTTLATKEDKKKGFEAGANAYLVKSEYDHNDLIQTLKKFVL